MIRIMVIALCLMLTPATSGAANIFYTDNGQTNDFIDPYPAEPWTCNSTYVPAERCYANWSSSMQPDLYILNGAIPVDVPSMGRVFYYTQIYTKSDDFGGPANVGPNGFYERGGVTVFSAPRTWHGIRGNVDLVLENDNVRPHDGREWTVDHGFHDGTRFVIFASAPRNGSNYVDGYTRMGVSTNGITFTWYDMIFWEQSNDYRMLGVHVLPDPNVPGQLSGVISYKRHSRGLNGTASIKIHPNWNNPAASTFELLVQSGTTPYFKTFLFGDNVTGSGYFPNSIKTPGGQTLDRISSIVKATYGGVTQYELWRDLNGTVDPSTSYIPCANGQPTATYNANRADWKPDEGGMLKYLFFDMNTLLPSSEYVDLTSTVRNITPAHYPMWGTWLVGRVDFGQTNMLYLATRDGMVCHLPNGWDEKTGKTIHWMKLSESIQ